MKYRISIIFVYFHLVRANCTLNQFIESTYWMFEFDFYEWIIALRMDFYSFLPFICPYR